MFCIFFFTFRVNNKLLTRKLQVKKINSFEQDKNYSESKDHVSPPPPYLSLPVLDLQLHRDLQSLPVPSCLGNIITNLLGGQTQRTNLPTCQKFT